METHPHTARLHVPHLSADHDNRLFQIQILACGILKGKGCRTWTQTVYSDPFECVSSAKVVNGAAKRKTREEMKDAVILAKNLKKNTAKIHRL